MTLPLIAMGGVEVVKFSSTLKYLYISSYRNSVVLSFTHIYINTLPLVQFSNDLHTVTVNGQIAFSISLVVLPGEKWVIHTQQGESLWIQKLVEEREPGIQFPPRLTAFIWFPGHHLLLAR